MAEITPMMQQYLEIKEQNKDAILFFRLGGLLRDVQRGRQAGLPGAGPDADTPGPGKAGGGAGAHVRRALPLLRRVHRPAHRKGYKVAICEQTEDRQGQGPGEADIIRVITPGTVDSSMLEGSRSNYICGLYMDEERAGVCFCDITTGKTHATAFSGGDLNESVANELGRFHPVEAVVNDGAYGREALVSLLREKFGCRVENYGERRFNLADAQRRAEGQFGKEAAAALPQGNPTALMALGGLLDYLYETQKTDLSHINSLEYYEQGRFLELTSPPGGTWSSPRRCGTRRSGAPCCGCWTRPRPPWGDGSSAPGWSGPCWTWPPSTAGSPPWRPWWGTPWAGRS